MKLLFSLLAVVVLAACACSPSKTAKPSLHDVVATQAAESAQEVCLNHTTYLAYASDGKVSALTPKLVQGQPEICEVDKRSPGPQNTAVLLPAKKAGAKTLH